MANEVLLQEGHPVDENLRPLKVGGKATSIETAQHGNGVRVAGDLIVTGDIKGNIKDMVLEDVTLDSLTTNSIVSTNLTIDDSGDITLDAAGGQITFTEDGSLQKFFVFDSDEGTLGMHNTSLESFRIKVNVNAATSITTSDVSAAEGHLTLDIDGDIILDAHTGITKFYLAGDTDDLCTLTVAANGATTIATSDSDGTAGHLTLDPNGDLIVSGAAVKIDAGYKLYLDGGGDTYIDNPDTDVMRFSAGGDTLLELNESGDNGNLVSFGSSAAGFTRLEATFSTTGVIASGGTDDTDIDFRFSNKYRLEMTGDITTMNLIFPAVSGNFLLVCTTNGDHDVSNWKVYESDESAATTTDVMWAGGSVPAFTDTGVDIVSFYWDADEQQAYGVASLAFATP